MYCRAREGLLISTKETRYGFKKQNRIYLFYVYQYTAAVRRGHQMPWKVVLLMVVSLCMDLGTEPGSSARAANALNL